MLMQVCAKKATDHSNDNISFVSSLVILLVWDMASVQYSNILDVVQDCYMINFSYVLCMFCILYVVTLEKSKTDQDINNYIDLNTKLFLDTYHGSNALKY